MSLTDALKDLRGYEFDSDAQKSECAPWPATDRSVQTSCTAMLGLHCATAQWLSRTVGRSQLECGSRSLGSCGSSGQILPNSWYRRVGQTWLYQAGGWSGLQKDVICGATVWAQWLYQPTPGESPKACSGGQDR